ncbi:speckle-type POZ protein-like [Schistocerca piceifrons]|uniref:speckle-type POZ protein-like n=1 Tax=Schistocerca piceifrons TaxID=274613 RepID=UPI001F5F1553|nr:speckle-type POZ protein-like [Schistocerca piceifrons]
MNFSSNTYRTLSIGSGTVTSAFAEVAAQTPTVLKYSSGTRFEDFSSVHTWTVTGLKTLCEGTTCIESAPLTHQNGSKWCMILTKKANELLLCFLLKKSETNKILRAKLKTDEILPTGVIREVLQCKWYHLKEGEKTEMQVIRKADNVEQNYNENEIVLQCEICLQCVIQDELPVPDTEEPHGGIVKAVDEMMRDEVLADFELHAGNTVLKAHRALLAVRSPYFAAMLQPHTKEAKEGRVEVRDVKPEILKQIMLYMYTGVAPALKDMPFELLIAADKYQLHQLKRQCETHIASCLNVDNAAATAANASVFSCDLLWDRAIIFIRHNLCEVMRTPGWAETVATHPEAVQRISELMG